MKFSVDKLAICIYLTTSFRNSNLLDSNRCLRQHIPRDVNQTTAILRGCHKAHLLESKILFSRVRLLGTIDTKRSITIIPLFKT